jgi:hypothetical protein
VSLLFYLVYFITLVYITSYYNTNLIKISSPHLPRFFFFFCLAAAWEAKHKLSKCGDLISIRLFQIISIPSKFCYFHPPDHVISMECTTLDFRCQCTQQKLQSICAVLTFDPQLNNILTFSVKDRYQLFYLYERFQCRDNYFFKIKFVIFLYLRLSASWKENDLPLCIYFWYQTDSEIPNTSIYSAVSLASPFYNYL